MPTETPGPHKTWWTLAELARELDEKPAQLRYWEQQLGGLGFQKVENGKRRYSAAERETFLRLHYLIRVRRYSIEGACLRLTDSGDQAARYRELRQTLESLKNFLLRLRENL